MTQSVMNSDDVCARMRQLCEELARQFLESKDPWSVVFELLSLVHDPREEVTTEGEGCQQKCNDTVREILMKRPEINDALKALLETERKLWQSEEVAWAYPPYYKPNYKRLWQGEALKDTPGFTEEKRREWHRCQYVAYGQYVPCKWAADFLDLHFPQHAY